MRQDCIRRRQSLTWFTAIEQLSEISFTYIKEKDLWMQNDLENAAEDDYYHKEMRETLVEIVQEDVGGTAATALNKAQKATRLRWCRERAGWTANDWGKIEYF
jgi:hypothetical protein